MKQGKADGGERVAEEGSLSTPALAAAWQVRQDPLVVPVSLPMHMA